MRVNPVMLEAFKLYSAPKRKYQEVPFTTLAHRIIYAESKDKGIDLYYLDNKDKLCSLVISGETSLTQLVNTHGAGFVRVGRSLLVNTVAMTGVFPISEKNYGCSVTGSGVILPVSRRCVKAAKLAFASINV